MQYHVSPLGSDLGDGSPTSPWQTTTRVNSAISGGDLDPGDIVAFLGGSTFEDEDRLELSGLAGTPTQPIIFTSYGSGRALLKRTDVSDDLVLIDSGSAYVQLRNINLEMPTGGAVVSDVSCVDVADTCANILIRDVWMLGGRQSLRAESTTSGRLERVLAQHAWYSAYEFIDSCNWTFDDLEAYGVGFSTDFLTVNATANVGDGIRVNDSATLNGQDIRVLKCKRGLTTTGTSTVKLYRSYLTTTLDDQDEAVYCAQSSGGTTILRDSIFKFTTLRATGEFHVHSYSADASLTLSNCTLVSTKVLPDLVNIPAVLGITNGDMVLVNTLVFSAGPLNVAIPAGTTGTYTETACMHYNSGSFNLTPFFDGDIDPVNPLDFDDFYDIGGTPTHGTTSAIVFPFFTNPERLGPDFIEVAGTSAVVGNGVDLSATYATEGRATLDYFGSERISLIWGIGAYEYPIPTLEQFLEGGSLATLNSIQDIESIASLRSVPPFSGFPAIDHKVESTVNFEFGTKRVGIWALGGRAGTNTTPPAQTISTKIYDYVFDSGASQSLIDGGFWDTGNTPGINDPRRIFCEFVYVNGKIELSLRAGVTAAYSTSQALSFSSVTSGLQGVLPEVTYDTDLKLTLEMKFKGRSSRGVNRNDYLYDLLAYVNDQLMLQMIGVAIPQGWIEGFDINNAVGPSVWAGIVGERSTLGGLSAATASVTWSSFTGLLQGTATPFSLPLGSPGEARNKTYMASRRAAQNRALNGGFGSFPKELRVQKLEDVIDIVDPNYTPPEPVVALHVGVLINGTDSMDGGERVRTTAFLEQMILNLPTDGSVMLCILAHRNTNHGTYGDIFPNVDVVLPNTILTPQTLSTVIAAPPLFNPGGGQERWASGLDALHQLFVQGSQSFVGNNKMVIIIDDNGSSDVGIRRSECASQIDAIHALPGLVECGILSVNRDTATVVGRAAGQGSWDFIFPRPIQQLPNQPLVDTNQSTTYYESTKYVPYTSGALVGRVWKFTGGLTNPPDAPIIQNPPLKTINSYLNNGVAWTYAQWCGYTWAQQIIKRKDQSLATIAPPGPPPIVYKDVYQVWPDLDASYAFDVPTSRTSESPLGSWFIYGASGSVEVGPLDDDGEIIPSYDGGKLARVSFGQRGSIEMSQEILDVKPLRGERVTFAYSGRKFTGRVRVDMVLRIDGQDYTIETSYSPSFGTYTRRTAVYEMPLNFTSLEVVLRFTGGISESVGISGVAFALGSYALDMPFSESMIDSVIPSGSTIMVTGDVCPPGYREVPDSRNRLALAVTGDPNFYAREFEDVEILNPGEVYSHEVDLCVLVDGSAAQDNNSMGQVVVTFLTDLVKTKIPKDGSVMLSIVWTSTQNPGLVLMGPTLVEFESITTIIDSINKIGDTTQTPNFGGGNSAAAGFTTAKNILDASTGRFRMVFYNTDHGFSNAGVSGVTAAFGTLIALDRFVEASAFIVNSSRAAVLAAGGENLIFPTPSTSAPGLLFNSTGGIPGPTVPGAYANQPYQAGLYASGILGDRVIDQVNYGKSLIRLEFNGGVISRIGGQEYHDHSSDLVVGSSISESDGFEDPVEENVITATPLPLKSQAAIKPYPYQIYPSQSRPEDPPVLAVGPQHGHSVKTDMIALPPSFPVRFCEKL